MNRASILMAGILATVFVTWIWHSALGRGELFAQGVDTRARTMLDYYEMPHIRARMERGPLMRRVELSGQADDFQRREIKRMVEEQPGVAEAVWSSSSLQSEPSR